MHLNLFFLETTLQMKKFMSCGGRSTDTSNGLLGKCNEARAFAEEMSPDRLNSKETYQFTAYFQNLFTTNHKV